MTPVQIGVLIFHWNEEQRREQEEINKMNNENNNVIQPQDDFDIPQDREPIPITFVNKIEK